MAKCKQLHIPRDVCYISFTKKKGLYKATYDQDFNTVRGEMLTLDYDKKGNIIGIELLGAPGCVKPCQRISKGAR